MALYKVEKKKYKLSKTFKKRVEAANKRLARFEKQGLSSNEQKMYQDLIRMFNQKHGISDENTFNPNRYYTKEQRKEMQELIEGIYKEPKTDTRYWKKFYKEVQEGEDKRLKGIQDQFDFKTEQELISFIDNMERFKQAALMQTVLSSDQYEQLHLKASRAGFKDLDKRLAEIYTKTGATKENLYNLMYDVIKKYEKGQKAMQKAVDNMF